MTVIGFGVSVPLAKLGGAFAAWRGIDRLSVLILGVTASSVRRSR